MRLSWNEIRARAAQFAEEWKNEGYERGEAQTFYNEFFQIFGVTRRRVATFEEPVKKLGDKRGRIDLFWKGKLLIEAKSAGADRVKAKEQALDYFPGLKEQELPRYVLVCDFQNFDLYDLDENTEIHFTLATLPDHVQAFGFILGIEKVSFRDQDPVNIEASELMGELHDALEASGYTGHDLERFLVRILFCLFADDASIFEPRGILQDLLTQRTGEDGSDTGQWLSSLFEALNTPENRRQKNLDEDLKKFPYVNGDLFKERLRIPQFDKPMREALLRAADFNWEKVSPAIFGALFQSVMDKKERRAQGAHYTTEKNILKVIQPLFLDDLWVEFNSLKARKGRDRSEKLFQFHQRVGEIKFFDPACGCGNFLIIAYRELRLLEIEIIKALFGTTRDEQGRLPFDVTKISKIDVDQFYGIEISEFPALIAEVAMWMMDHIMNNTLSLMFGENYARIPLKNSPHIHCADALEIDWAGVLPPEQCSYVYGNPPFIGAKFQSEKQRAQVRRIAALGGSGGTLDYVCAWFLKAGEYVQKGKARIGFVATNSITQGEQVAQLWPLLFDRYKLEIAFAHRTFAWGSDARGKAHVHVVIVGLTRRDMEPTEKRLFNYDDIDREPTESRHKTLTPYLFDAGAVTDRHLVIEEVSKPINGAERMIIGSKPIDGGYLILDDETELNDFLNREPAAKKFVRPFIGAVEYINGGGRWILSLQKASPNELRELPAVAERLQAVKDYRNGKRPAKRKQTTEPKTPGISAKALAQTPAEFHVTVIPEKPFLLIPEVSSERRDYVPIGWQEPPTIPSNLVRVLLDADLWDFAILTSRMHMAWLRHIGGRLKSDYRYSIGLVYNTFPWPNATEAQKKKIRELAQAVLDARAKYPQATLADLYDPDLMKADLRKAHRDLDLAVDRLYRAKAFEGDRDRVEHLFGLYEKLVAPLTAAAQPKAKSVRRKAR